MLVSFHFLTRSLFAHGSDAQADLLFFRVHFDDLEVVLLAGFQVDLLTVAIDGFGIVAQALDTLRDLNERAEARDPKNLAV